MNDNRPLDVFPGARRPSRGADARGWVEEMVRLAQSFVLYWLHHAMRAYENPALDVAVTLGESAGAPFAGVPSDPER